MRVGAEDDAERVEEEGAHALVEALTLLVPLQREPTQLSEGLQAPVDDALFHHTQHQALVK